MHGFTSRDLLMLAGACGGGQGEECVGGGEPAGSGVGQQGQPDGCGVVGSSRLVSGSWRRRQVARAARKVLKVTE